MVSGNVYTETGDDLFSASLADCSKVSLALYVGDFDGCFDSFVRILDKADPAMLPPLQAGILVLLSLGSLRLLCSVI